jgi:methionyl-tRNA formyltransferase
LGGRRVGIPKASLSGEPTDEPPGTIGRVLEDGSVLVATADEWIAVRRLQTEGHSAPSGDLCAPGDRFEV